MGCCSVRRPPRLTAVAVALLTLSSCTWISGARPPSSHSAFAFTHASTTSVDTVAGTASFPLIAGVAGGEPVFVVVLESSDSSAAATRGVTYTPRLAELRRTAAVQRGRWTVDGIALDAGVDFSPAREVQPGAPDAFPPTSAAPGAVGRNGYSPFVEFADGSVWTIAIVANSAHEHDRVVRIEREARHVVMRITRGYGSGKTLWYLSTEASDAMVAALEGAIHAPAIASAAEGRGAAQLVAFVNGPMATEDAAERHGMRSAMSGEGDPLNILAAIPGESEYAPLWDLHMAMWAPRAVRDGLRERLLSTEEVSNRESSGLVQGMDGALRTTRTGALVNCPVIAVHRDLPR